MRLSEKDLDATDCKPSVSVVFPVRNEGQRARETILSIVAGRSRLFPLQIVVVDDQSSDYSCAAFSHLFSKSRDNVRIDVVRLPQWSGIPYARNTGASHALADILFITDANVQFPSNWDVRIRQHLTSNRVLCATIADSESSFRGYGGTLHFPSMGFQWLRRPEVYRGYVPISPCTGTVISTDLFRRVGGFDTGMPVYGAAEPEFSVRLWLSGAEIISIPDLVLEHRFRPPSERLPFLEAIAMVQVQNYLRFGLLYLDRPGVLRMLQHYSATAPRFFDTALRRVWSGDVWTRRELLRSRLPVNFDVFAKRFGLGDATGQFAFR